MIMKSSEKEHKSHQLPASDELETIQNETGDNGSILKKHKKKKKNKASKAEKRHSCDRNVDTGDDTEQDYNSSKSSKKHKRKREKHDREDDVDTEELTGDLNKKRRKHKTDKINTQPVPEKKGNKVLNDEIESDSSNICNDELVCSEHTLSHININNKQEENDNVKENEASELKKKCKKKKSKKKKLQQSEEAKGADKKAIDYLKLWKSDRNQWSFQKVRQVWLLQNMYQSDKVSDTDFTILLEYLEGLQGRSRSLTVEEAQKIISAAEDNSDTEIKTGTEVSEDKMERARQILQLLT